MNQKIEQHIPGLHHVTAIAGDPQKNIDFYAGVLGLRFLKKTVNFDDPYTYHFYFGDTSGQPGTILTFFPWASQAPTGTRGAGQLASYAFAVPHDSMGFWKDRLARLNIPVNGLVKRFGEDVLIARDEDGFELELVASSLSDRAAWDGIIPLQHAARGFHSVSMIESMMEPTIEFLTGTLGFRKTGEFENRYRFETGDGGIGTMIDVIHEPQAHRGQMGVGIIHHVAWRTPDDAAQLEVRNILVNDGYNVTPVIDRNYFHSIYFNDPGGAIFEVATDPPGFLIDEPIETLGTGLKLPTQYEPYRAELERVLPPVTVPGLEQESHENLTELNKEKDHYE